MEKKQTYVNSELAIKPYYYMRNGLLHIRYTVDRAMVLTDAEERQVKEEFARSPSFKQEILARMWSFLEHTVGRAIKLDGLKEASDRGYFNGLTD